ncbi:PREDICTED: defensin-like protein P322 [Ipomoea nil]|uniref:defensin-like protein P322 n=1 Tax=Ipomoea nil TaxID=35883 RepID=UPI000901B76D|nr:PREDICTED: defensin-like protein P322 [Ipomoea nil]
MASSSSSVRLFATASLLVMLLIASEMGIMAGAAVTPASRPKKCVRKILKLKGLCLRGNLIKCNKVCKSDRFAGGICLRFVCICIKGRC